MENMIYSLDGCNDGVRHGLTCIERSCVLWFFSLVGLGVLVCCALAMLERTYTHNVPSFANGLNVLVLPELGNSDNT